MMTLNMKVSWDDDIRMIIPNIYIYIYSIYIYIYSVYIYDSYDITMIIPLGIRCQSCPFGKKIEGPVTGIPSIIIYLLSKRLFKPLY